MHAWGLRLRRALRVLAIAHPSVLPSTTWHGVGTLVAIISQLNTLPACAPVNASMATLRLSTHDSGAGWSAKPFLYDSFIHYSTPVYPGARHGLLALPSYFFGLASATILLPNMNPISAMARGWFWLMPDRPKASPGVTLLT
jgi:hypothetical protein